MTKPIVKLPLHLRQLEAANKKDTEPALRIGSNTSMVATIALIIAFLVPGLDEKYVTVIAAVAAVLLPLINAYFIRKKVWSPATVQKVKEDSAAIALMIEQERRANRLRLAAHLTDKEIDKMP
jgi:uncharacterized membrane protein